MHVHQDPTSRVLQDQADGENPVGCFLVPEVNEDADSAAQEQVVLSSFAAPHSRQTLNLELIRLSESPFQLGPGPCLDTLYGFVFRVSGVEFRPHCDLQSVAP